MTSTKDMTEVCNAFVSSVWSRKPPLNSAFNHQQVQPAHQV